MAKILITTSSFQTDLPEAKALEESGYEIILNPHGRRLSEDEVAELLQDPEIIGMIAGVEPLTAQVLSGAAHLQVISRCGTGMDSVDMNEAERLGIAVYNTPDAPVAAVSELAITLMLDALRQTSQQDRAIREGLWVRPMGRLLGAARVGLIGYGRIGRRVGEIAASFGAQIMAYDPLLKTPQDNIQLCDLDALFHEADIISLHVPYSDETRHIIDAKAINQMKKGAVVINTARGGLVDENALYEALQSGHLAAAALDVYEDEPYSGKLKDCPTAILSAHTGSYAKEAREQQEREAAANLLGGLISLKDRKTNAG